MRYSLLMAVVLAGCSSKAPVASIERAVPMNLSVATLMDEYHADATTADQKFLGVRMQLLGNVEGVCKPSSGERYVVVRRPNEPAGSFAVHCYFDPFWDSLLGVLERGDSFDNHHQLIGTLERSGEQLVLKHCSVEIHRR